MEKISLKCTQLFSISIRDKTKLFDQNVVNTIFRLINISELRIMNKSLDEFKTKSDSQNHLKIIAYILFLKADVNKTRRKGYHHLSPI